VAALEWLDPPFSCGHWSPELAMRSGRVYVVDGSHYFSRPGPWLVDSLEILADALHPEVHPLPAGLPAALHLEGSEPDMQSSPAWVTT